MLLSMNVVIDESSESGSEKFSEENPKEILPPEPKEVQEIVEQEPAFHFPHESFLVVFRKESVASCEDRLD